jgi:hypothetical protein
LPIAEDSAGTRRRKRRRKRVSFTTKTALLDDGDTYAKQSHVRQHLGLDTAQKLVVRDGLGLLVLEKDI